MFQGYKTYLIAGAMLVYQFIGYFVYSQPIDFMQIMEAAGLATLRAGVAKI
jgi:hypothetical protein